MMIRFWLAAIVALGLVGCATPARVDQMVVDGTPAQRVAATPYRANLALKEVTGGKETNPMWTSQVDSAGFEQALEQSLQRLGLYAARQGGKYTLTASLQKLEQPLAGFNMTVTAVVEYTVVERSTNKTVFQRTLTSSYTAPFNAAFAAVERLKIANEGAIRTSITDFIDALMIAPAPVSAAGISAIQVSYADMSLRH